MKKELRPDIAANEEHIIANPIILNDFDGNEILCGLSAIFDDVLKTDQSITACHATIFGVPIIPSAQKIKMISVSTKSISADGGGDLELQATLIDLNKRGYNLYLQAESFWVEKGDNTLREPFVPWVVHTSTDTGLRLPRTPDWAFETMPGVFQRVFNLRGVRFQHPLKDVYQGLVQDFNCDPLQANSAAFVPLPGSFNHLTGSTCRNSAGGIYADNWPGCSEEDLRTYFSIKEPEPAAEFRPLSESMEKFEPEEWLIQDFVGSSWVTLLQGQPASGKSFMAIDIALAVASGSDWHGKKVLQGPVVYFAGERSSGLATRMRAWGTEASIPVRELPISICDQAPDFSKTDEVRSIATALFESVSAWAQKPALVVVDTYARHIGVEDENQAATVAKVMRNVDKYIRKPYGCAILIVHHQGKGSRSSPRGSSSLRAAIDAEFSVTKKHEKVTVSCTKMNEAEHPQSLSFYLKSIQMENEGALGKLNSAVLKTWKESKTSKAAEISLGKNQRLAIKAPRGTLKDKLDGRNCTLAEWSGTCRDLGMDRRRVTEAQNGLIEKGVVLVEDGFVSLPDTFQ